MDNNERLERFESHEPSAEARTSEPPRAKQRRGFAAMDPARQREIASKGGRASHAKGTGHEWNATQAREAGRKGGLASRGGRGRPSEAGPGRDAVAASASTGEVVREEEREPGPAREDAGRDTRGEF